MSVSVPTVAAHAATKGYVDGDVQRLDGLFGELDDRTFETEQTLEKVAYKSGARQAYANPVLGFKGYVTVSRVGYVVTIIFSDWNGSVAGTGGGGWTGASVPTLPVGFRPPADMVDGGHFKVTTGGNVQVPSQGSMKDRGEVFTFVVTDDPPASFTWGDPVT